MATKPHGWAGTRTSTMLHYFGLTREGAAGYRPNGTPLALCHNAIVKAEGEEFTADPAPDRQRCRSCEKYLASALEQMRQTAGKGAKLAPGSRVKILRGKNITGLFAEIEEASKDFPGFWYVKFGAGRLLLSEGQLELRK